MQTTQNSDAYGSHADHDFVLPFAAYRSCRSLQNKNVLFSSATARRLFSGRRADCAAILSKRAIRRSSLVERAMEPRQSRPKVGERQAGGLLQAIEDD
jgi:hypothetical protein